MTDPRIEKLADVLINYSLALKPGDRFLLQTRPVAQPLNLAVYRAAIQAGAHVLVLNRIPGTQEIFFKEASDEQLDYSEPIVEQIVKEFDAALNIMADYNTRELSNVDPKRQSRARVAQAEISRIVQERVANGEMNWCLTLFPTNAAAQEADMSLSEYEDFVYDAGHLNEANPVSFWEAEAARQQKLISWLDGHDQAILKGANIDLQLSIRDRNFVKAAGHENFPDGEIYTSPVESSVNGWVRFSYPAIFGGREVTDIELWFEEGKVVREKAKKGEELLTALLDSDPGARYLGEWGIGTNYNIQRFTKEMLFDEKMGGTIHLAVGFGFPEAGSENQSSLHWDMLCDMSDSEIRVDGDLFYQNGKIVIED